MICVHLKLVIGGTEVVKLFEVGNQPIKFTATAQRDPIDCLDCYYCYMPCLIPSVMVSEVWPVDEWISHGGGNGAGLGLTQTEHTLNDGQLCAGGVQATEGTPVVDHHPSCNDLTAPVDCSCLWGDTSVGQSGTTPHSNTSTIIW